MIASPQLLVVQSHLLSVVVKSGVLAIYHKIHSMGSIQETFTEGWKVIALGIIKSWIPWEMIVEFTIS